MLDSEGNLKVIDFDTVCRLDGTTTSDMCGTVEYQAPEMFMRAGYD